MSLSRKPRAAHRMLLQADGRALRLAARSLSRARWGAGQRRTLEGGAGTGFGDGQGLWPGQTPPRGLDPLTPSPLSLADWCSPKAGPSPKRPQTTNGFTPRGAIPPKTALARFWRCICAHQNPCNLDRQRQGAEYRKFKTPLCKTKDSTKLQKKWGKCGKQKYTQHELLRRTDYFQNARPFFFRQSLE